MENVMINLEGYDWLKRLFDGKDLVSIEDMIELIDELQYDRDYIKEEFEDYKNYVADNYKPIPYGEQVDISDKDFI